MRAYLPLRGSRGKFHRGSTDQRLRQIKTLRHLPTLYLQRSSRVERIAQSCSAAGSARKALLCCHKLNIGWVDLYRAFRSGQRCSPRRNLFDETIAALSALLAVDQTAFGVASYERSRSNLSPILGNSYVYSLIIAVTNSKGAVVTRQTVSHYLALRGSAYSHHLSGTEGPRIPENPAGILCRRESKHPRIIPTKLRCAFVADLQRSSHHALGIGDHELSGL